MDKIDFRSDTVTWPTPEMREAMASARLGDDVYGEDPTVNELEDTAAARLGKQAGLFVASGTMGNLAAILAHCDRGDEAIAASGSHVIEWEAGGMASLGGVVPRVLPRDEIGRMQPGDVAGAAGEDDPHLPRTRLVLLENSFGECSGAPLEPEYFEAIGTVASRRGLAVHLDGARLFNAATALELDAATLARQADSVTFCLSKGLCAPAGSVLCGTPELIHRARRVRKALGGGMRQAGVLAAAGLIALEKMTTRLAEDHVNARLLADKLSRVEGVRIDPGRVRTNIVHFDLDPGLGLSPNDLVEGLRERFDVLLGTDGARRLRAVTHYWITPRHVEILAEGIATEVAAR